MPIIGDCGTFYHRRHSYYTALINFFQGSTRHDLRAVGVKLWCGWSKDPGPSLAGKFPASILRGVVKVAFQPHKLKILVRIQASPPYVNWGVDLRPHTLRRKLGSILYALESNLFCLHWWCATVRYQKVYREPEDCLVGVI